MWISGRSDIAKGMVLGNQNQVADPDEVLDA